MENTDISGDLAADLQNRAANIDRLTEDFQRLRPTLVRWLSRRIGDPSEAHDIAHEAYIRVWNYAQHTEVASPTGLLFKTAGRLALNELRRRKRHSLQFTSFCDFEENNNLDAAVERARPPSIFLDDAVLLFIAVSTLPERPKTAFLMHRIDGYNYSEIARRMNVSRSSVEKYIIRALSHLR